MCVCSPSDPTDVTADIPHSSRRLTLCAHIYVIIYPLHFTYIKCDTCWVHQPLLNYMVMHVLQKYQLWQNACDAQWNHPGLWYMCADNNTKLHGDACITKVRTNCDKMHVMHGETMLAVGTCVQITIQNYMVMCVLQKYVPTMIKCMWRMVKPSWPLVHVCR